MPLMSEKEVRNLKLNSMKREQLKEFCEIINFKESGKPTDIIKKLVDEKIDKQIDEFLKKQYLSLRIKERQKLISDEDLMSELNKVNTFIWGIEQGQLDRKIQTEYVRKFVRYNELISGVKSNLHDAVTSYVICSWYNHWTTVLIEEHIAQHKRVIPTVKSVFGVDIFFDDQPFDLKITSIPEKYEVSRAISNPIDLAIWMYEHQGEQRFASTNRLFVICLDKANLEESWKLKRNFSLVFSKLYEFFDSERVTTSDELAFTFKKKTYTTVSKVLLITK